ncbi:MAG TPA: septum formation initiator family protein [Rhizomicrobium sp.]|nr:septum formation initiator family protein [Rhizomicrobium sp.]
MGMRIRYSVTRFFSALVIPAICTSAVAYFGYYAVWGSRGLLVLTDTQARLSVAQEQLASLKDDRARLEHRIQLLKPGSVDPDLVEEIARDQLLGSTPGQVAVPRSGR